MKTKIGWLIVIMLLSGAENSALARQQSRQFFLIQKSIVQYCQETAAAMAELNKKYGINDVEKNVESILVDPRFCQCVNHRIDTNLYRLQPPLGRQELISITQTNVLGIFERNMYDAECK